MGECDGPLQVTPRYIVRGQRLTKNLCLVGGGGGKGGGGDGGA